MLSSTNVALEAGILEDGIIALPADVVIVPATINLGEPGEALHTLPFRGLGGSILDLDLLYGVLGSEASMDDIQPIFAMATRNGFIRGYGKEIPRPALQAACIETFATLKSVGDITIEGTPVGSNLFGSVGLTTRPTFTVTLDNSDGEWNLLVLRELMAYAPAGIFVDIAHAVVAPVVTGTISSISFEGSDVVITGGFSARIKGGPSLSATMDLDQVIPLRRAGEYTFSELNAAEILPEVFGNWLSTDAAPAGSVTIGTPCVMIDSENLVYCANARQTASTPPEVYWNGEIQEPSEYIWNPADNYEGRGVIATLTFSLNSVGGGIVTVRHGGAVDGAGQPITNPFMMLYHMLTERAGWTLASFDRGTCEQTRADMEQLGYPAYWVWQEEKSIRDWLLEICPHYHCDFTETANAQLAVVLDRTLTTLTPSIDYHIREEDIDDQGSPAQAVSLELQADDVVNQVLLHGRYNWSAHETTVDYTWDYLQSQNAYRAVYPAEFTFRGMYTLQHATQWLHSHALRHGFDPTVVSFSLVGLKGLPLIPPRVVTMEWPRYNWVEHMLKIRQTTISFEERRVSLQAVDCQRELSDAMENPSTTPTQRLRQLSRIYQWLPGAVGDRGQLPDAPHNPRNEAANGDFELGDNGQVDLYGGNPSKQWEFIESPLLAYRGSWFLRNLFGSGNGTITFLRNRIDPGEHVVISAWFCQELGGTNGRMRAAALFYDADDVLISTLEGTPVVPTGSYLESVAYGTAPPNAYYYRPSVGFTEEPTFGNWRADHVFAASGTLSEVLAARQGDVVSRNFIINGDFELGPVIWDPTGTWTVSNDPAATARSGVWVAAHFPTTVSTEERLNSQTKVSVTAGQVFRLQCFVKTLNNPNGTGRIGVTWVDGQGNAIAENATAPGAGPIVSWTLASGEMTVPSGAVYAHCWVGVSGHNLLDSFWIVDDVMLSVT